MARDGIPSAVLLDALGHAASSSRRRGRCLRAELAGRGVVVDLDGRARGDAAPRSRYYRAHHDEARDWAALKDLRRRCAAVVHESLGTRGCRWPTSRTPCSRRSASAPTPRCPPCCARLRAARRAPGRRLATGTSRCTTCSSAPGLAALVDAVVISAELGVRQARLRRSSAPRPASGWGPAPRRRAARRRQRRGRRRRRARRRHRGGARRPRRRAAARRRARRSRPGRACST